MPDPELIDKAAALLADARKPLLFVGGGAVGAAEEVRAIAEMLEAPVVSYTGGKGIVTLVVPGGEGEDIEIRLKDRQLVTAAMKTTIQSLPGVAAVESV